MNTTNITFNRHEWEAQTYDEPDEIIRAFNGFDIYNKYISDISVIGYASKANADYATRRAQHDAGIPYDVIDNAEFKFSDKTLVPWSIQINEPLIITFTDGMTLELQAVGRKSLKISVNKIPKSIIHGTNINNIDARALFAPLIGSSIQSILVLTLSVETVDSPRCSKDNRSFRKYQFKLWSNNEYGLSIIHHGGAWYDVELFNKNHFIFEGNEIAKIPHHTFCAHFKPIRQILIVEGHDYSSYFWIRPVQILDEQDKNGEYIYEDEYEEISIDEDDVLEFLYYFLEKNFDSSIQQSGEQMRTDAFEWNLTHNLFTYESVQKMISDMREVSHLFRTDFDNAALGAIKKRFRTSTFLEDNSVHYPSDLSDNDKNKIYKNNIGIVLDFYERFCRRMEQMMKHATQYNLISFMGP